jgi:hypothetical protein
MTRMLHYTKLERLASDKQSSLLSPFVIYEENEVLTPVASVTTLDFLGN